MNRSAIAENERRLGLGTAELVGLRHADTPWEYSEYVRLVNRRIALRKSLMAESESETRTQVEGELAKADGAIKRIEEEAVLWLHRVHSLWQTEEPINDDERAERDKVQNLYAQFGEGQLAAHLDELNVNLTARTETAIAELRPRIRGKICLVGYTASGVADLVTSPVYSSMPGVMAHANIINMVLQNQPAVHAPGWLNVLILMLGGIVITTVTCAGPAVQPGIVAAVGGGDPRHRRRRVLERDMPCCLAIDGGSDVCCMGMRHGLPAIHRGACQATVPTGARPIHFPRGCGPHRREGQRG